MGTASRAGRWGTSAASGTFLWVDSEARVACAALTDREFGDWAKDAGRRCPTRSSRSWSGAAAPASGHARPLRLHRPRVVGEERPWSSSNVAWSQLATTHGVIAVTVAVRGTLHRSAT